MKGLLDYLPSEKLGYVVLYRPKLKRKESDIIKILQDLKRKYEPRFNCFFIEGGWSKTLEELKAFCSK